MDAFARLRSPIVALLRDNVDTDQIIPARFLKGTIKRGLGRALFADWRYDAEGQPRRDFVLNQKGADAARILVTGANFGCGSSREHAVWALMDFGFRAVVARSFADIFRGNALKNGLLPVALDADAHAEVMACGSQAITIDLAARRVSLPDGRGGDFDIPPFARYCLLQGIDELDFLLCQEAAIAAYEVSR